MRRATVKLPLLLLIVPFLLLSSCSDGDAGASGAPTSTAEASKQPAPSNTAIEGRVKVDFTGAPQELDAIDAAFEVEPGSTAWDAVKMALGEENLTFMDFGGDLGIFISGFNGVDAEGNHFWEFRINGQPAEMGVSKYEVQAGDVLEFVYSSF